MNCFTLWYLRITILDSPSFNWDYDFSICVTDVYFIDSKRLTNLGEHYQYYRQYRSLYQLLWYLKITILDSRTFDRGYKISWWFVDVKNYEKHRCIWRLFFFQMNSFHSVPFSINFGRWYWQRQCFSAVTKNLEALCLANLSCIWHFSA